MGFKSQNMMCLQIQYDCLCILYLLNFFLKFCLLSDLFRLIGLDVISLLDNEGLYCLGTLHQCVCVS